jgi:hypothetical protein
LYCDFPLGRPLGRPSDVDLQHRVLAAAFATLAAESGPVWEEFPEVIADGASDEQVSCALPPRLDPAEIPAVDEAKAIKGAFQRTLASNDGRTNFGRVLSIDTVPGALAALDKIANHGVPWDQAGLPADPIQTTIDLRAYYVEAAFALADSATDPARTPWALERWFYADTQAGRLLLAARAAMKEAGVPQPIWFYMSSLDQ